MLQSLEMPRIQPSYNTIYMYTVSIECRGIKSHPRQLFLCESDCIGCVVLLCFVVYMTLLVSSFLPHLSSLIDMYSLLAINALLLFPTGSAIHQISQDIERYTAGMYIYIHVCTYTCRLLSVYM